MKPLKQAPALHDAKEQPAFIARSQATQNLPPLPQ